MTTRRTSTKREPAERAGSKKRKPKAAAVAANAAPEASDASADAGADSIWPPGYRPSQAERDAIVWRRRDPPSSEPRGDLVKGLRSGDQVVIFADCPPGWNASADGPPPDVTIPAVTSRHNRDRRVAVAAALGERLEMARDAARDAHRAGGPAYRIGGPVESVEGFLLLAGGALLDAAADMLELDSWEATGTNQVTFVGELVSTALRRRWLWDALVSQDFHLGKAAQLLRLASGPPAIARMIKDLGMAERVERARAELSERRGGRPRQPG